MSKHMIRTSPKKTEKRKSYDDDDDDDEGDDLPISKRYLRKPTTTPPKDDIQPNGERNLQNGNGHTRIKPKMTSGKDFTCSKRLELSFEDAWKEMERVETSNDVEIQSTAVSAQFIGDETKQALKRLKDMLSKDFRDILDFREFSFLKSTIKYLCDMPTNNGISTKVRLSIEQVSRRLSQWSESYTNASRKLDSTQSVIFKVDELEKDLQAKREELNKVFCLENELSNQLEKMGKRKKELENQINEINTNMTLFQSSKAIATNAKKEVAKEENILKGQRDELKQQVPGLAKNSRKSTLTEKMVKG